MSEVDEKQVTVDTFACTKCGADLTFKPGTEHLVCEYCGAENDIPKLDVTIDELDFLTHLREGADTEEKIVESFVKCDSCGASATLEPNVTSAHCPYCDTPLIVNHASDESVIKPKSLLPFKINKHDAKDAFKKWIESLWFAPSDLKKASLNFDHFKGIYIPHWTYDTNTVSQYIGQRGIDYTVSESYTTTENGKTVTRQRMVTRTRWYTVSGIVNNTFDDILVVATNSVQRKYMDELEPWDLENLVPYEKSYLSGFITEKYQVHLEDGFDIAKGVAENGIRHSVRRDIGGDHQRITQLNVRWNNITFKHILLPTFVSAYRFKGKLFQFVVNARTSEVQGERPLSWVKIMAAAIPVAVAIGTGIYYYYTRQQGM